MSAEDNALRVALCEDTAGEAIALKALIDESLIPATVSEYVSGEDFLQVFTPGAFDLIFLDVYMGGITGVEVAERVREVDSQVVIVFTTTSEDFTREGYRLNAYKYMIKPVGAEDVLDSLELALLKRDKAQGATISVICDGTPRQIALGDIEYVEANNRRTSILLTSGEEVSTQTTIDTLEKMLPAPRFLRSHRSFIVNLDYVAEVEEDFIMDSGARVYIRVKDYRKVKHAYDDYLFNNARSGT